MNTNNFIIGIFLIGGLTAAVVIRTGMILRFVSLYKEKYKKDYGLKVLLLLKRFTFARNVKKEGFSDDIQIQKGIKYSRLTIIPIVIGILMLLFEWV